MQLPTQTIFLSKKLKKKKQSRNWSKLTQIVKEAILKEVFFSSIVQSG